MATAKTPNLQTPGSIAVKGYLDIGLYIEAEANNTGDIATLSRGKFKQLSKEEYAANAVLLASAYNAFDQAGRVLGIDAAELAKSIDLVALWRTAAMTCGYGSDNASVAKFLRENNKGITSS